MPDYVFKKVKLWFKCPVCKKDFGNDKEGLDKHFKESEMCGFADNIFRKVFDETLKNISNDENNSDFKKQV